MAKKKKTNRQKRTLVGAICVAAVIMAGSTFAWFTSQDDVTNRLTAQGNYGVAIAENSTPPQNLVPGQKVTKEVMATNTGNIAALVRLGLKNSLSGYMISSAAANTSGTKYVQLGDYTFDYALGRNGKTGSTKVTYSADSYTAGDSSMSFYAELADVMAGGYLVYTPAVNSTSTKVTFSNPDTSKTPLSKKLTCIRANSRRYRRS